jgi:hypothetical protein
MKRPNFQERKCISKGNLYCLNQCCSTILLLLPHLWRQRLYCLHFCQKVKRILCNYEYKPISKLLSVATFRCPVMSPHAVNGDKVGQIMHQHFSKLKYEFFPVKFESPETNVLNLVGQGDAIDIVEGLDCPHRGAEVVLRASHRGQVDLVARFLRYLGKKWLKN